MLGKHLQRREEVLVDERLLLAVEDISEEFVNLSADTLLSPSSVFHFNERINSVELSFLQILLRIKEGSH